MASIDQTTPHLSLPLPHRENPLAHDVDRIRAALLLLDADATAQNGTVSGHVQALAQAVTAERDARMEALEAEILARQQADADLAAAVTPSIGANGHWLIGATDTGLVAAVDITLNGGGWDDDGPGRVINGGSL
jgi:hypothetical protein